MRRYARISSLLVWLLLVSTGAYASARLGAAALPAATGPSAATSSFSAAGIHYTLSATNPSQIARVAFTLVPHSPGAQVASVRVKLLGASSSYFACTNIPLGSASWECPISGVAVVAADQLTLDVDSSATSENHMLWLPLISNASQNHVLRLPLISNQ